MLTIKPASVPCEEGDFWLQVIPMTMKPYMITRQVFFAGQLRLLS